MYRHQPPQRPLSHLALHRDKLNILRSVYSIRYGLILQAHRTSHLLWVPREHKHKYIIQRWQGILPHKRGRERSPFPTWIVYSYMGTDYRPGPTTEPQFVRYGMHLHGKVDLKRNHLQDCAEGRAEVHYRFVSELLVYHTHCMRLDGKLRRSTTRWAVRGLCRRSGA